MQNNGGDNLTVTGSSFIFSTAVAGAYNVTLLTQPDKQRCFVATGVATGTATANVSNITIACASQKGGAMQGIPLNLTPAVSTLAGAPAGADGKGAAARFSFTTNNGVINGITSDGTNLYVVDAYNKKIRKIVIATGEVSTLAGSGAFGAVDGIGAAASFSYPSSLTLVGANLYVVDLSNNKIRKIVIATGEVSSFTGVANTQVTNGAADGASTVASFSVPTGITNDGTNLYVVDSGNNKIRKIVLATGAVSSLTGAANTASTAGAADGAGASASFSTPEDITTDGTFLYVADTGNHKIRKIVISSGVVSSLTGTANTAESAGVTDGNHPSSAFTYPYGVATDGTNLYVADTGNNKIRLVKIATVEVSSLTGLASTVSTAGNVDGTGSLAQFNYPMGITTIGGKLYVTDKGNNTIRSFSLSTAEVSTLAGNPNSGADGTGAEASIGPLSYTTTDGANLYVADTVNNKIRKVVIASGVVTTLAGSGTAGAADGTGTAATFYYPQGITIDGANLYVADSGNNKIRKIVIATGEVSSFTGMPNTTGSAGAADGVSTAATFNYPQDLTTDGSNLYVADTNNNKIRKVVITTGAVSSMTGVVNTRVNTGAMDGAGTAASFYNPQGITTDGSNLYVSDWYNCKIRKVVIATGMVSSLTGITNTQATCGAVDGGSTLATFYNPAGVTTDGTNLYVADKYNFKIRKVVIATGEVSSLPAMFYPTGITTDGAKLFITDLYTISEIH